MAETDKRSLLQICLITLLIGLILLVANIIGVLPIILKVIFSLYPILLAILLSFLFEPSIQFLMKHKIVRPLAVIIVYGLAAAIFITICLLLIPSLLNQIKAFLQTLPSLLTEVDNFLKDYLGDSRIRINVSGMFDGLTEIVNSIQISEITNAFSKILYFMLSFVGAVFLSFDFSTFKRTIKKIIPKKYAKFVIRFFREYLPYIYKYVKGMLLDSLILWALASIALTLSGLEYPILFALIVAFLNLVPMIGAYIGGAPAVLVAFTVSSRLGVTVLIIIIILQLIESNFIQPYILRNVIQLHPIEGILSLILLGTLFGVVGMIVSPLFWTAMKIGYAQYREYKSNKHRRVSRFAQR